MFVKLLVSMKVNELGKVRLVYTVCQSMKFNYSKLYKYPEPIYM